MRSEVCEGTGWRHGDGGGSGRGEAKYEERNKWVLRWSNWAHPQSNNLHVHVHLGMKGRVEHDLAVIASADDYFYSRLRTHHGEGPLAGRTDPRHFVCEGMRGLLDLVGSLGRGDELDTHTKHP